MQYKYFSFLLVLFALVSCRKGDANANKAPNTKLSVSIIDLSGDDRLNSKVRMSWFGTDLDGFVEAYEFSLDNQNWTYTTIQDSIFIFPLEIGQDTTDIDFYVRSIDNEGLTDPTPAYLRIPLKNSAPEASFDHDRGPKDSAFCVSTFYWRASDPDGNETLEKIFLKFNDGTWTEIARNQNLISFLVDTAITSGPATGQIYYGRNPNAETFTIDGLLPNAENVLYIKSVDLAGAESSVDTSNAFYLKNKTPGVNTLWLNGHVASVAQQYRGFLNSAGVTYDFLDYGSDMGAYQPIYWDPTFKIILSLYDKLFLNAPSSLFPNTVTGENTILLNYIGRSVEEFHDKGGKSFTTCALLARNLEDLENVAGPFAIENTENSTGFTRMVPDSSIYNVIDTIRFPKIKSEFFQTGVVPIIKSADSEVFFKGQLTKFQGWTGDNVIGTIRRGSDTKISQVFIAVELHNYAISSSSIELLIGEIMKNEF